MRRGLERDPAVGPSFEVVAFEALPASADVLVLELEGRLTEAPPRLGVPRLLVEAPDERLEVPALSCSDRPGGRGARLVRAAWAVPMELAHDPEATFALAVARGLLLDLPAPDAPDPAGADLHVRLARAVNALRRELDAARDARWTAEDRAREAAEAAARDRAEAEAQARQTVGEGEQRAQDAVRQADERAQAAIAEAEQRAQAAVEEADRRVLEAREDADRRLAETTREADGRRAAEVEALERRLAESEERRERELAEAREDGERVAGALREQADRDLAEAREEAERRLAEETGRLQAALEVAIEERDDATDELADLGGELTQVQRRLTAARARIAELERAPRTPDGPVRRGTEIFDDEAGDTSEGVRILRGRPADEDAGAHAVDLGAEADDARAGTEEDVDRFAGDDADGRSADDDPEDPFVPDDLDATATPGLEDADAEDTTTHDLGRRPMDEDADATRRLDVVREEGDPTGPVRRLPRMPGAPRAAKEGEAGGPTSKALEGRTRRSRSLIFDDLGGEPDEPDEHHGSSNGVARGGASRPDDLDGEKGLGPAAVGAHWIERSETRPKGVAKLAGGSTAAARSVALGLLVLVLLVLVLVVLLGVRAV